MSKKYFGTDGIRGSINSKNINGEMFFKFGLASGTFFRSQKKNKQTAVIAKDTRLSGYMLEPALVSGLTSAGMHVYTLGPLPTNGLAMLTKAMKANMGIMITASHNPHYDNGLKLFGPDGMKLSDKFEKKIENLIDKNIVKNLSEARKLGRVKRLETGTNEYIKILKKNFTKEFNLRGLRIVIDCANGAGYKAGPELLKSLGAKVIAIGVEPTKLIATTSLLFIKASTASLSPLTTLKTPSGRPASFKSSANLIEQEGSFSDGFKTNVFPQAIAMGNIHIGTIAGKLKGVIPAQTPRG